MNQRRIFISIDISSKLKNQLWRYHDDWLNLPVRWVNRDNYHITLLFIGQSPDEKVGEICQLVHDIAPGYSPFSLKFNQIRYTPSQKNPPFYISLTGESNSEIIALQNDLKDTLTEHRLYFPGAGGGRKDFQPHITLGRIQKWEWRKMEPEEVPEIQEKVDITVPVTEFSVVESKLRRQGPEYIICETAKLKEQ